MEISQLAKRLSSSLGRFPNTSSPLDDVVDVNSVAFVTAALYLLDVDGMGEEPLDDPYRQTLPALRHLLAKILHYRRAKALFSRRCPLLHLRDTPVLRLQSDGPCLRIEIRPVDRAVGHELE